jgi:hypothetical protein
VKVPRIERIAEEVLEKYLLSSTKIGGPEE